MLPSSIVFVSIRVLALFSPFIKQKYSSIKNNYQKPAPCGTVNLSCDTLANSCFLLQWDSGLENPRPVLLLCLQWLVFSAYISNAVINFYERIESSYRGKYVLRFCPIKPPVIKSHPHFVDLV